MKIIVNGDAREIRASTLDAALSELGYEDSICATALNGEFIAKAARRDQRLLEGDRIEIVAPMQGG